MINNSNSEIIEDNI